MTEKPRSLSVITKQQHQQLLLTKLDIPHLHDGLIPRDRVMEAFDRAIKPGCTLVSAPAGSGKTLAVAEWVHSRQQPAAWLTLDQYDNDPHRFWTYLFASLDRLILGIEKWMSLKLSAGSYKDPDNFIMSLINELVSHQQPIIVVLDDFHLIKQEKVIERLTQSMSHLKDHIRLILVGRGETNKGIDPLDTLIHLNRIGVETLCFDRQETESLMKLHGIQLTPNQLKSIETQTEGWAMGLTLMIRSLQEKHNPDEFLAIISKKNQQLYDYLAQEVYTKWPREIQEFLLKTSILNRMTPSLCNAVTGRTDSRRMLRQLSKDQNFIICLNHQKGWYRYHNMLTSFLRLRLYEERRKEVKHLYQRAANHYEENGIHHEAVEYYLKGRQYQKAATLIEKAAPEMLQSGRQSHTLGRWLQSLPEGLIEKRHRLLLAKGWSELLKGRNRKTQQIIVMAERACHHNRSETVTSDWPGTALTETRLLEANLAKMEKNYEQATALMEQVVNVENYQTIFPDVSRALFTSEAESSLLASVHGFQGRISLLQLEKEWLPIAMTRFFGDPGGGLKILMAEIHYERNEIDLAVKLLMEGMNEAEAMEIWGIYIPAVFLLVKIMTAQGNTLGALQTAGETGKKMKTVHQQTCLLQALETRLNLLAGDLEKVSEWMDQCHLSVCTNPAECHLYEQMTRLRVLVSQKNYSEASLGLIRLASYAKKNQCLMNLVEIQTLHATCLYHNGNQEEAMKLIEAALSSGQNEGYKRIFMDEGQHLLPVLKAYRRCSKRDPESSTVSIDYIEEIIRGTREFIKNIPSNHSQPQRTNSNHQLIEPLTQKESLVLHCLSRKMTNQEIADHLGIKATTVKVHTRNIYSKLYVTNRTQAVEAARGLGLL